MKILNTTTFEKLNIDPIQINDLDNVALYRDIQDFTKKDLKTFDIVKIKDLLFMYVSYEDFYIYKGDKKTKNGLRDSDVTEGVFARYKPESQFKYAMYCVNNYTRHLINKFLKQADILDVYIASENTIKHLKNDFNDKCLFDFLNQDFLNDLLKTNTYKHYKHKSELHAKNI